MKPWYSFLARTESGILFWLFILLVYLSLVASNAFAWKLQFSGTFSITTIVFSAISGAILSVIFSKLKLAMFPMGVFALGQGAKRHKDKEIIRTGIIVAFAISLMSSMLATLLFSLWR